jgi:type II secretory pathway pseudopilin PulG
VVVAFVLLALVFSTAFEIFTQGLSRAGALEERSRALEVVSSQLAGAGMEQPLAEGTTSGESRDPRYRWTRAIRSSRPTSSTGSRCGSTGTAATRRTIRSTWRR